jgi:hypothetical protein
MEILIAIVTIILFASLFQSLAHLDHLNDIAKNPPPIYTKWEITYKREGEDETK